MEIKEAIRAVIKELVLPELNTIKSENQEIKIRLELTNKRLDDVNSYLADQSRRIDETNKRIDSVKSELVGMIMETNKRIDDTNKRIDVYCFRQTKKYKEAYLYLLVFAKDRDGKRDVPIQLFSVFQISPKW